MWYQNILMELTKVRTYFAILLNASSSEAVQEIRTFLFVWISLLTTTAVGGAAMNVKNKFQHNANKQQQILTRIKSESSSVTIISLGFVLICCKSYNVKWKVYTLYEYILIKKIHFKLVFHFRLSCKRILQNVSSHSNIFSTNKSQL